jgi:hypothetical protein
MYYRANGEPLLCMASSNDAAEVSEKRVQRQFRVAAHNCLFG